MSKPPYSELENWNREPEPPEANEDVQARARQKLAELAQTGIFEPSQSQGWTSTREEDVSISYGESGNAPLMQEPPSEEPTAPSEDYGHEAIVQETISHAPMPASAPMPPSYSTQESSTTSITASTTTIQSNYNQNATPNAAPSLPPEPQAPAASEVPASPQIKATKKTRKPRRSAKEAIANGANFAIGKKPGPIVPKGTIAGNALVLVIAIMSFLAALTVAAVTIVADATRDWQADIGRGATIQIRQIDGVDIEAELAKAVVIARQTPGIGSATALSVGQSNALLEPWLGLDLVFDDLPVPRLIELSIDDPAKVDFATLSTALQQQVKGAVLDNHRFWVERLRSMAESAIIIGFTILALVISATVLTVIFATRSAMSGNKETIEVLHFVGASHQFIAGEFQRKFFILGLQGSFYGGLTAVFIFVILQFLIRQDDGSATLDQMQALLGVVELGYSAYAGTLVLIILIAIFTAITTRLTVMKTLSKLI